MKPFERADVVNRRILHVWESPPTIHEFPDDPPIAVTQTYVELDNGAFFELHGNYADGENLLGLGEVDRKTLRPAEIFGNPEPCNGEIVLEVVVCSHIMSVALLLSSRRLLHMAVDGPAVGTALSPLQWFDVSTGEFHTYWEGTDLWEVLRQWRWELDDTRLE